MHRRLMLTIVIKIDDRKKNENFVIVAIDETNKTNETNEKEINKTIAIDEATKEKKEKKRNNNKSKSIFNEDFLDDFNDYNFQFMKLTFRKF